MITEFIRLNTIITLNLFLNLEYVVTSVFFTPKYIKLVYKYLLNSLSGNRITSLQRQNKEGLNKSVNIPTSKLASQ